jgi:hypothetical protein
LESDKRVRDAQLALQLCVALGEREQLTILVIELRLAAGLLRLQALGALGSELLPPLRQVRAVDAFSAQHGLQRASFTARDRGIGRLQQPQSL